MHESQMTNGHVVAAKVFGQWHRGQIIGSPKEGVHKMKVRIFFLDYGTCSEIEMADVKYLLEEFAEYPRQSFRGCLYGIQPVQKGMLWDLEATTEMLKMVSGKEINATLNRVRHHVSFFLHFWNWLRKIVNIFNFRKKFA